MVFSVISFQFQQNKRYQNIPLVFHIPYYDTSLIQSKQFSHDTLIKIDCLIL